MDNIKIDRINTLAHKAKSVGLTEAEKLEQAKLRREYIEAVKKNFKAQLNNISVKTSRAMRLGETICKLGRRMDKDWRKES